MNCDTSCQPKSNIHGKNLNIPLEENEQIAENIIYFNSTKSYTIALLNAFNELKYFIPKRVVDENGNIVYIDEFIRVPIKFGSYEKYSAYEDISPELLQSRNYNFLPRMVLSFEGMSRATDRQTGKYNKIQRVSLTPLEICEGMVYTPCNEPETFKSLHNSDVILTNDCDKNIIFSYNSSAYDFNFKLLLQTRGMTQATQLTEQILGMFNPSMNLNVFEFILFKDHTQTQVLISDPSFEINEGYEKEDLNLIDVSFDVTVRGNIYRPIKVSTKIKEMKWFMQVWDTENYQESKLATYFNFDYQDVETPQGNATVPHRELQRTFDATLPVGTGEMEESVTGDEQTVMENRPDYQPPESGIFFHDFDNTTDERI